MISLPWLSWPSLYITNRSSNFSSLIILFQPPSSSPSLFASQLHINITHNWTFTHQAATYSKYFSSWNCYWVFFLHICKPISIHLLYHVSTIHTHLHTKPLPSSRLMFPNMLGTYCLQFNLTHIEMSVTSQSTSNVLTPMSHLVSPLTPLTILLSALSVPTTITRSAPS